MTKKKEKEKISLRKLSTLVQTRPFSQCLQFALRELIRQGGQREHLESLSPWGTEDQPPPWSCARTCGLAIIISVPRYSACPSFLIVRELELLFWTCRGWNICQTRLLFLNDWWSVAQSSLNSIDRITNGKTKLIQTWLNLTFYIIYNKYCRKLYFYIKIHTLLRLIKLAVKIEIETDQEKTSGYLG